MRVLDLFSGIGGFSLGLESVGMETVAFCEADGYARRVLRRHWPDVWLYEDVRTLTAKRLKQDGITEIDLICGGFPCQDISYAGKGEGIEGALSGLWSEYARLIKEVKPRWVVIENVAGLRSRGLVKVLRNLSSLRYDAEWHCIPAFHAGAPHIRDRIWIVAYPSGSRRLQQGSVVRTRHLEQDISNAPGEGDRLHRQRLQGRSAWKREPKIKRVVDGVPCQVDRLRCLGNAVVPQVVAMIGQAVLDAD